MVRVALITFAAAALEGCGASSHSLQDGSDMAWADGREVAAGARVEARREDWRCGAVVYQVFVDRFAPPDKAALAAKRDLYARPRKLMKWTDPPVRGRKNKAAGLWSHELHFWGGDLASLRTKLDHVEGLGADVLYLNPIHAAYTNHKYDAQDFFDVSPEYGTRDDVKALASDLHDRGMRLMLDGVFNHMGATSPHFVEAKDDPDSPWRDWFIFNDDGAHQGWYDVANLPEVNLESPAVRARLWGDADSVVRGFLADGVDGWRLDVAYDLGPVLLDELVESARLTKSDAWVVGEIWNYPERWAPPLDGVMNFHVREILMAMADGRVDGGRAGAMIASMIDDFGVEHALRSWLILDNHDTDRLASWSRDDALMRLLVTLHMTLPGCPVIYYGSELGMAGVGDPGCRGPMRWDLATADNTTLAMWRELLELREAHPALRWGDFVGLEAGSLLAFARETDKVGETVIVLANPSARGIDETFALPLGKVMPGDLEDIVATGAPPAHVRGGVVRVEVPAKSVRVLRPRTEAWEGGYTSYGRVH